MKVAFFAAVFLLAFVYKAECTITGWNTPVIATANGNGTVTTAIGEHTAAGNTTITLFANNAMSYALLSQIPSTIATFAVASGGTVSFTGSLNYEEEASYVLVVLATDNVWDTGTATVTITIADEPDQPAFDETIYGVVMTHGAGAGANVISLTATEEDAGQTVASYALGDALGGTAHNDFAVDNNGVITVANSVTLDMTTTSGYALYLEAVDDDSNGATTGTTVIVIAVTASSDAVAIMSGMVVTMIAFLVARFM